jgi:hypothetical protein
VRRGAAWTVERHQVAAWSLPWSRSRWQSCYRRANLGCRAAGAGPTGGGSACPGGPPCGLGDRGCPNGFRAVRPFLSASLPVRHGVPGGVDGVRPDRPDMRCPEACPIVASIVDAGHDRADIGRGPGLRRSGIEHGRRWSLRTGPDAGSGWRWPKASMAQCRPVLSCPVRAMTCRSRGWPWPAGQRHGRTLGARGVRRLPPLSGPGPDHRLGGHLEMGVSGRPDGREVRHVRRPASGCRVSAGGD